MSSARRGCARSGPFGLPTRPAIVTPLAPERYKVQVTISRDAHDKLRRAQELLRHTIPNGDPAAIVERALSLLVDDLERKRCAAAKNPRPATASAPGSRHVPAAVKREVWARDESRCAFVGALGRCPERGFLELHHVVPFADGGATGAANLELRCRAHNAFEAEKWFGIEEMRGHRDGATTRSGPSLIWNDRLSSACGSCGKRFCRFPSRCGRVLQRPQRRQIPQAVARSRHQGDGRHRTLRRRVTLISGGYPGRPGQSTHDSASSRGRAI